MFDWNAYHKKDRRKNPVRWMLIAARQRAKRKGLAFNLTKDDIQIPEYCPALGIKLEAGLGKSNDAAPSLDRLIPSLGYIKGNVVVVSLKANRMKNNATPDELIQVANFYQELMAH